MTTINVTLINNLSRSTVPTTTDTTIRALLEANGFDYARRGILIDGSPAAPGDLDKSFADFGITGNCYISSVVKADNA